MKPDIADARNSAALTRRSLCLFGAFMALGSIATFGLTALRGDRQVVLVFLTPVIFVVAAKGVIEGLKSISSLLRSVHWWHRLWLVAYVSSLVFRIREVHEIENEAVDSWALFRIALVGLTGAILLKRVALRQSRLGPYLFRGLVGILTGFGLLCLASTLWSGRPFWTLYKSLELLIDIALLAAVLDKLQSAERFENFFDWTWSIYGASVAFVWLGILVWPHEALIPSLGIFGFQLQGVLPAESANSVSEYGAILAVVALSRLLTRASERRAWYGLILGIGLITMVFAQGRSAIAGFVLGAILVLWFSRRRVLCAWLSFGAVLILSQAAVTGLLWEFLQRGESDTELYSLSSRIDWWQVAWQTFVAHPFLGYGAFGGKFAVLETSKIDLGGLHSEYVEVLTGTGLLGLAVAVMLLVAIWWTLFKGIRISPPGTLQRCLLIETIGVMAVICVRSIFTNNLFVHAAFVFLTVLGYAEFVRRCGHKSTTYARIDVNKKAATIPKGREYTAFSINHRGDDPER